MKQLDIALLDTDTLQVTCTLRDLSDAQCNCVSFSSSKQFLETLRRGVRFDGVLIALHGNGDWSMNELRALRRSAPHGIVNVMLIAHEKELVYERKLVGEALLEGMEFLRSPIDRTEFFLRFEHLISTS